MQALPVLRLLKRDRPTSEIYWWVNDGLAPLLEGVTPGVVNIAVRARIERQASPLLDDPFFRRSSTCRRCRASVRC